MSGIAKTNRLTTLRGSSANIAVGLAAIVVSRISRSDAMPYLKELLEFLVLAPPTVIQEIPVEAPRHKEGP